MSALPPVTLDTGATHRHPGRRSVGTDAGAGRRQLGLKCHVFAPSPDCPAFEVVHRATVADYTDTAALDRFAADVDVVTYEFENVPAETATFLVGAQAGAARSAVLAITQDRLIEKSSSPSSASRRRRFAADRFRRMTLGPALDRLGPAGDPEDPPLRL